jgi:hypothetical protein
MRTWGRIWLDANGNQVQASPPGIVPKWIKVETDAQGFNDMVYATALVQVLKLNLGESPFYQNWGIPAKYDVITQIFPDYYVTLTQQRFQARFASLIVAKQVDPTPTYRINITTHVGVKLNASIPIPT